jgi:hypothetical protein
VALSSRATFSPGSPFSTGAALPRFIGGTLVVRTFVVTFVVERRIVPAAPLVVYARVDPPSLLGLSPCLFRPAGLFIQNDVSFLYRNTASIPRKEML